MRYTEHRQTAEGFTRFSHFHTHQDLPKQVNVRNLTRVVVGMLIAYSANSGRFIAHALVVSGALAFARWLRVIASSKQRLDLR